MNIGQLARDAGVPIDTVRYYERNGLLPPPPRRVSGYRDYPPDAVPRLRFIRRAKAIGFTLSEIRELLTLSERRSDDMADVKILAAAKLVQVDLKLADLARIRDGLDALVSAGPGSGAHVDCPILGALSRHGL